MAVIGSDKDDTHFHGTTRSKEFGRALTILQAPGRDAWVTTAWQTP